MKLLERITVLLVSTWLLGCHTGIAATLYTEPLGASAQYPAALASWQYVGIRFELDQPAQLTALHAEMGDSPSSFFAALVQLPSVTSLPQGNPFAQGEVLYSTIFNLDWDFMKLWDIPFTVSVDPGAYAIIFGAGQFGSSGYISAVAGTYNSVPASTGFVWVPDSPAPLAPWHDTPSITFNVSVEGTLVPEPSSVTFVFVGLLTLRVWRMIPRKVLRLPMTADT